MCVKYRKIPNILRDIVIFLFLSLSLSLSLRDSPINSSL